MRAKRSAPCVATVLLAIGFTGAAACGSLRNSTSPGPVRGASFDLAAEKAACVDQINTLRASVGRPALRRAESLDTFSDQAARVDAQAHDPHLYFRQTNGAGISMAQNEIPWWKLSMFGSVSKVIRQGLTQEFAEGPGGGHFDNITGTYSEVACGIAIVNDEVTVTQDFR